MPGYQTLHLTPSWALGSLWILIRCRFLIHRLELGKQITPAPAPAKVTQGRGTRTTRALPEKHSLPRSTRPVIALKSCSATRIHSVLEFSVQRVPAKLTIFCKMQELAVFGRDRWDLWAAAQHPAMPCSPAPGMLHVGLPQPLLFPVERPPGCSTHGVPWLYLGGAPFT